MTRTFLVCRRVDIKTMTLTFNFFFNIIRVLLRQNQTMNKIYDMVHYNFFCQLYGSLNSRVTNVYFSLFHTIAALYILVQSMILVSHICINASYKLLSKKTQYFKPKIRGTDHTVYVDFELKSNWSLLIQKILLSKKKHRKIRL